MKFIKLNLLSVLFFTSFLIAQDDAVEEVVVTGSYIKGSPTDGASPVEIVSRDTIDVLNASTVADITANLTVNSGSENNTDSFTQGSTQGTTNVNLRGLGLSSTLVLIDGKRQTVAANTANDGSVFVNTSAIPVIALDRVEILKEGAASVYGSDAIAGVVNYILRKDFKGAEIDISTQETDTGGQTDNRISFIYGTDVGQGDLVVAFSQLDRSPLAGVDRPELAQLGISGFGNSFLVYPPAPLDDLTPAQYVTSVADGPYAGTYYILENVPDANCVANKGILQPQPNSDVGKALEAELGGTRCGFFYGDRFNVVNDEDHMSSYVSYSQTLSNGVDFSIDYLNTEIDVNDNPQSPSYPAGSFLSASKLILPGMAGSPFSYPVMWIGRPLGSTAPSPDAPRAIEVDRTSINFSGSLDAGYDWSLSYTNSNDSGYGKQPDISTSKFDAALAGTGGASGTEMWNLFDPLANSAELTEYIKSAQETWIESSLSVLDFVLTGSSNGFDFAGGVQFKKEEFVVERSENTIVEIGSDGSLVKPADLVFLGGGLESDDSRSSFAMFAEISKDVSDKLQVKTALRFEDLESDSTVNPKISVRYEATDDLILRGSISTSFREASLAQLTSTNVTLQGLQDFDSDGEKVGNPSFIRVAQAANADLQPEEATNMNFGAIWSINDNLSLKIDYWNIDYSDLITIESAQGKIVANPNGPDIQRVAGTLSGVTTSYFNASEVNTDGYDLEINYDFDTRFGQANLNYNTVHILSYEIPLQTGVTKDVVGLFNHDNFARSLPDRKTVLSASLQNGNHQVAAFVRKTGSYATSNTLTGGIGAIAASRGFSQKIDSHTTVDVNYAYNMVVNDTNVVINAGIKNLFDEDVPLVYDSVNFSYDSKQHDPRGQMMYIGAKISL